MMKRCCTCKDVKPLSEFGESIKYVDGFSVRCKVCATEMNKRYKSNCKDPIRAKKLKREYEIANRDSRREKTRVYRAERKEHIAAVKRAWKVAHPEKLIQYRNAFNEKNPGRPAQLSNESYHRRFAADPDAIRTIWRKYYRKDKAIATAKKWKASHPEAVAELTMRRNAKKVNATPFWANKFFIKEIYHLAYLRTKMTGIKWEVDHIVPLNSPVVCGLHVEHNLRVIPAVINNAKNNKLMEALL